jgi:hypothetical protein
VYHNSAIFSPPPTILYLEAWNKELNPPINIYQRLQLVGANMVQYFTMPPLQWNNCLKVYLHKVKIERDVNYNRGLTGCIKKSARDELFSL